MSAHGLLEVSGGENLEGVACGQSISSVVLNFPSLMLTCLPMTIVAEIWRDFGPATKILSFNRRNHLGLEGLRALVQGMTERKQPVWGLKTLNLVQSTLGSVGGASECSCCLASWKSSCFVLIIHTDIEASLDQLS